MAAGNHRPNRPMKSVGTIFGVFVILFLLFPSQTIYTNNVFKIKKESGPRKPVKIIGKETLYLKVLTRPQSRIYQEPNDKKIKHEYVDTFRIYYAYTTPNETPGFYEIGLNAQGATIGYIKEEDVIEWKQYLTLKFNNKEKENRTLFFRNLNDIESLMYNENRPVLVEKLRQEIQETIGGTPLPETFPVIAVEPSDYVNIHLKPYLLPILDFKQTTFNGKRTRILKVASAVIDERKSNEDLKKHLVEGLTNQSKADGAMGTFKADVVFVIDTTRSMGPYIRITREVIRRLVENLSQSPANIHFGLVGYRDDTKKVPGLEYRTKVFCNLEEGSNIQTFLKKIEEVKETSITSIGFNEDVWAGVYTAMKDRKRLKHRKDTSLFIVQIGDAGAHDFTGQIPLNASSIGQLAEDEYGRENRKVWIFSIHLKTPAAKKAKNIRSAEIQFRQMVSKLPGVSFYHPIENGDPEIFQNKVDILLKSLADALHGIAAGNLPSENHQETTEKEIPERQMEKAVKAAIRAAALEHIGSTKTKQGAVTLPRDIQAWTLDRDLTDPDIRPLDIMLLITRNNLSLLRDSLKNLTRAGRTEEMSSEDFFDQLQSLMSTALREPEMIQRGVKPGNLTLGKIGILPEFIEGLPYKTQMINMSPRKWRTMAASKQSSLLKDLKSKIAQYEEYYKNNDIWIELNEGDKPGDHVTFLRIDRLP